jgi:hypothetical protein
MRKSINYLFFIFLSLSMCFYCSSTQSVTRPSQSEFYSFWDHSVTPPIQSTTEAPSSTQAPAKKKK